ncbi:hypothetical protein [Bradyrhizobium oligotrophicum]|uniref:hypothetical protein n=1 Tax=Bradyrhizobium oligotrophicum TaxID=44255 RepID=UPI003EBCBC1B
MLMDKNSFIEKAPPYYALGLALALLSQDSDQTVTLSTLEHATGHPEALFRYHGLVRAGMRILVQAGVAEIIAEDFGPRLYRRTGDLTAEWIYEGGGQQIPLFRRYAQIRNLGWLNQAIVDVNENFKSLGVSSSDFDAPAVSLWQPLPLDRTDEALVAATERVDEAIRSIEGDNGYAAHAPGERDYVVQSLKTFSATLKENAQITGMQIKTFALEPLAVVMRRFAGAGLEMAAGAAKDAIVAWLKVKFGALITYLLS